ncbi:Holliday junction branch migration protein RuvA [Candidatus Latescibacterota bacterium]
MIVKITGKLISVSEERAYVEVNGITYTVLITHTAREYLTLTGKTGQEVTLYTFYYIEGNVGIGNLFPRLVGFLNKTELDFFTLLITVQGLSVKKTLKALAVPVKDIARAIELNDTALLKKLPEIGGKIAQKMIVELKGKVAKFALLREEEIPRGEPLPGLEPEYQREAIEILLQLQYTESEAETLVHRAVESCPDITAAEDLIQEIFRKQVKAQE